MSLAQQNLTSQTTKQESNEDLMYKVILQNDLAGLTPLEKVQHVKNVCTSLGLNPLTKPIQLLKFQGKEIPYMTKDGSEQIRNLHNVSIVKLETELLNGDLYIVKAYATKPNGRQDCSTSAQSIANLKGEAIGNAMKKCETQAKRRVTLSICGLGMLDESEIEDLPKEHSPSVLVSRPSIAVNTSPIVSEDLNKVVEIILEEIECSQSLEDLKIAFEAATKTKAIRANSDMLNKIIAAKDKKRCELEQTSTLEVEEVSVS
jgi:hypothetical protein